MQIPNRVRTKLSNPFSIEYLRAKGKGKGKAKKSVEKAEVWAPTIAGLSPSPPSKGATARRRDDSHCDGPVKVARRRLEVRPP